jgi:hypothetical protein
MPLLDPVTTATRLDREFTFENLLPAFAPLHQKVMIHEKIGGFFYGFKLKARSLSDVKQTVLAIRLIQDPQHGHFF